MLVIRTVCGNGIGSSLMAASNVKKICDELGLRESSVASWSYRKQHAKVGFYKVAQIIKAHTEMTDEEFFEPVAYKSLSNN